MDSQRLTSRIAGLLDSLPSRGTLLAPSSGSLLGSKARSYVCQHDTDPPEHQVVRTDTTNILIRSLRMKIGAAVPPKKGVVKAKAAADAGRTAKRPAPESKSKAQPSKRQGTAGAGEAGPSAAATRPRNKLQLEVLKVAELQDVLRQRGCTVSGNKAELIDRILHAQGEQLASNSAAAVASLFT